MQRILVPALGLLGLAALCFFCIRCHAPRIEADLAERGRTSLAAAGHDPDLLDVDGRHATLAGSIASETGRDEAAALVRETRGVRAVDNRLSVDAAAGRTLPFGFRIGRSGDRVTLDGVVPTELFRRRIVDQAHSLWGANRVDDQLRVDPSVEEPGWLEGLPGALETFSRRTDDGSFDIGGGSLVIGGRVFAEAARQDLLERLRESLAGLEIVDRLEVLPPTSPAELQATLDTAIFDRTVEFETDSAELTVLGRKVLDEVFELLDGQPSVRVGISGHTDSRGGAEHNLDLSRRRAQAARDYLVGRGLAAERFETSGFGGSRPVADNRTPEGRQKNRRIEFQVLEEP